MSKLKQAVIALTRKYLSYFGGALRGTTRPELEAVYQHIFTRDVARIGIQDEFYPVGAAANYSFLYLILRATRSLKFQSILELGAGQTTLLLNALRAAGVVSGEINTIEHDTLWGNSVGNLVTHKVQCLPLVERTDGPYRYKGYDLRAAAIPDLIDLLLIDGPVAWQKDRRYSRHGALPLLDRLDREGFVIVVDDAEREGESALVERIRDWLLREKISFQYTRVSAAKCQAVFASGKFSEVAFY
ncbi:hypothetical protein ACVIIV_007252 [Bradyrhizobium sp. USDA 4354]